MTVNGDILLGLSIVKRFLVKNRSSVKIPPQNGGFSRKGGLGIKCCFQDLEGYFLAQKCICKRIIRQNPFSGLGGRPHKENNKK